jgi:hypothetical protein
MKKINKLATILVVACLSLFHVSCENGNSSEEELINAISAKGKNNAKASSNFTFDGECLKSTTNLIAGQNMVVGTVDVVEDGTNYNITYNVNIGWCLTETHLDVEESPANFPMTNSGNPKNGQFEYSSTHACASSYTYVVPKSEGTFIAAHAVVSCEPFTLESIAESLPEEVNACTTAKGLNANNAYFDITLNDSNLKGDYIAWCVDADKSLNADECFDADVYSSYEELPQGEFEFPENFDLVNWIMNQNIIGSPSPSGGNYTFGDVQQAIWGLVDSRIEPSCTFCGPWATSKAQEIIDLAKLNGEGFVPECGQVFAIILIPQNNRQSLVIPYTLPCNECEETAWGQGCDFPGNNWSMYFQYGN